LSALTSFLARHGDRLLLATAICTACGVAIFLRLPLTAPGWLVLGAIAPVGWYIVRRGRMPSLAPAGAMLALLLGVIYLAMNASWSLSPADAQRTLVTLFLVVIILHLLQGALADSDPDVLRALLTALYAGMAIGGVVLCFDVLSHQWFHRQLIMLAPELRPEDPYVIVDGGKVVLPPYLLNRSIAALTFLFWPTMLTIALIRPRTTLSHGLIAALIPAVAAVAGSVHATSKIALLGSTLVFIVCVLWPVLARRAITWGWILMIVFVVPLASLAYKTELYRASWLPPSAQHRIVIWGHTSQLVAEAPILGAGINTARALNDRQGPVAPGSDFRLTTSLHSHNAYLQTWYETGAVGAALLMAVGLAVIAAIARAPELIQPYLFASFAACALLAGSSFSLWQSWFVASFGLAASFAMAGRWLADGNLNAAGRSPPFSSAA
jgi:hypothetical protein